MLTELTHSIKPVMQRSLTVYDVIRILLFGGNVQLTSIKGHLLIKILNQGIANAGTGGFLQSANTQYLIVLGISIML